MTFEGVVQTALGAILVACLALTAVLLPCAWLYPALVVPVALTLVFGMWANGARIRLA